MAHEFQGALSIGPISRSTQTAAVHRLVRDGHANFEEFQKAIAVDQQKILAVQKQFAFISAGQSDWLDLLRPIALTWNGFSSKGAKFEDVGPVTRWFRTNTFYRKPTVHAKITAEGFELKNALPQINEKGIVFLLGPYSFSKLVENTQYSDALELACDYAQAVSKSSLSLAEKGYSAILFLEPYIGYSASKQETINAQLLQEPLKKLDSKECTWGVHFPRTDAGKIMPLVEETKINFIGIDTLYTQPEKISTSKDVLFGLLDGARVGIENKEQARKQLNKFLEQAEFSGNYYIGPNDRLWDVPFDIGIQKLELLNTLGSELK